MRPETRRAALLATAGVALCSAVVGCAPKATAPEPAAGGPAASTGSSSSVGSSAAAVSLSADACETYIGEALATDEKFSTTDPTLAACCASAAQARDATFPNTADWPARGSCCSLLEWQGSMTCTPWGPPVPPEMA
jgi:hypothetical protein